jgi:hypothetical protein
MATLLSLYVSSYSNFNRPRRHKQNQIKRTCYNKIVICSEYPNGVFIDNKGIIHEDFNEDDLEFICLQTDNSTTDYFMNRIDNTNDDEKKLTKKEKKLIERAIKDEEDFKKCQIEHNLVDSDYELEEEDEDFDDDFNEEDDEDFDDDFNEEDDEDFDDDFNEEDDEDF